jgi:hypothetical protein
MRSERGVPVRLREEATLVAEGLCLDEDHGRQLVVMMKPERHRTCR